MIRVTTHILRHARDFLCAMIWTFVARVRLFASGASVGKGLRVTGPILLRIHPSAKLVIGDDCTIHSGFSANPVGSAARMVIWVAPGATLRIGDRVGISNATIVATESVQIGDDVRIGGAASIYDTDFHSLDLARRLSRPDVGIKRRPVKILRGAFVGGHAIVLKGSVIGEESILGAGSVLAGNVPPSQIWAGNPARMIKPIHNID